MEEFVGSCVKALVFAVWGNLRVIWGRTAMGILVLLRAGGIMLTSKETM